MKKKLKNKEEGLQLIAKGIALYTGFDICDVLFEGNTLEQDLSNSYTLHDMECYRLYRFSTIIIHKKSKSLIKKENKLFNSTSVNRVKFLEKKANK